MNPRIRAVHDLNVASAREAAGLHQYDGVTQDLSPAGITACLARLGDGPAIDDAHDEAHLAAAEQAARRWWAGVEAARWNPAPHLSNLDLACYDREYAPAAERAESRRRHLERWPDAVDASLESLDRVPRPVARALLPTARGLAADLHPGDPVSDAALAAHRRLVGRLDEAAADGPEDAALGAEPLCSLMSEAEALPVDVGRLGERGDAEARRLKAMLGDALSRIRPGMDLAKAVEDVGRDHPPAGEIAGAATDLIHEISTFVRAHDLLPDVGTSCLVGPAPPSRRWAMAMMAWAAPYEDDAPSWYHVTPPDEDWPPDQQEEWLAVFSHTSLPAITAHEVTPGHFAHGRILRTVRGDVRRGLFSYAFTEGWAHYGEELLAEEGFRGDDPRYVAGVALEALVRVTRLRAALGIHTEAMSLDDAVALFTSDAYLRGPAARAEAERATYDPVYGSYTWGKLAILDLRDEAQVRWGNRYSHRRFHDALLALGAPPIGLIGDALT